MKVEFDRRKSDTNAEARGLPFDLVVELEWRAAQITPDIRRDYGEKRFVAVAPRNGRLHVVCYCDRGDSRRIISFPKSEQSRGKALCESLSGRQCGQRRARR